jgi:hypothetical protein
VNYGWRASSERPSGKNCGDPGRPIQKMARALSVPCQTTKPAAAVLPLIANVPIDSAECLLSSIQATEFRHLEPGRRLGTHPVVATSSRESLRAR